MQLPEPEPTPDPDAMTAALAAYLRDPEDHWTPVDAIMATTGWWKIDAIAFIEVNQDLIRQTVARIRAAIEATGGDVQQGLQLAGAHNQLESRRLTRLVGYWSEVAQILDGHDTPLGQVLSAEQLAELRRRHGLALDDRGKFVLAEDAPDSEDTAS